MRRKQNVRQIMTASAKSITEKNKTERVTLRFCSHQTHFYQIFISFRNFTDKITAKRIFTISTGK